MRLLASLVIVEILSTKGFLCWAKEVNKIGLTVVKQGISEMIVQAY